jgi:uncharacterized membrane protein YGL010W
VLPFVGLAVKVMLPPEQIEVELAMIDTAGITEPAVIFIVLLVAVVGFAQGALLVMTTVTASPLASDEVVKTAEVCPATFTPLIFH